MSGPNIHILDNVDATIDKAKEQANSTARGTSNVPDPRFNEAADENDKRNKDADRRVEKTADGARQMVNESRGTNQRGQAAVNATNMTGGGAGAGGGGLGGATSALRSTTPASFLGGMGGGMGGGMNPYQQMMAPATQFANMMAPAMMQAATAAPAAFNQSYSSNAGDQIVLTPAQQARLAAALEAAADGSAESTTLDGVNLAEGIEGEREQKVVQLAKAVVDAKIPYSWGGGDLSGPTLGISGPGLGANDNTVNGMDCSSYARYVTYQSSGVEIPRTSGAQWAASSPVSDYRAGDLVFPPGGAQGHVQIYIGNGMIAEQYQSGQTARIVPLDPTYEVRRPHGIE